MAFDPGSDADLHVSAAENLSLECDFLAVLQESRDRYKSADTDQLLRDLSPQHVAMFYGRKYFDLFVQDRTLTMRCFLHCPEMRRRNATLNFDQTSPSKTWHCTDLQCTDSGDLATLCQRLLAPTANASAIASPIHAQVMDNLRTINIGLQVWRVVAAHPVAAKIYKVAAFKRLGKRRRDLVGDLLDRAPVDFLLRQLLRNPDLKYEAGRRGTAGFAGYLFLIAFRQCDRAFKQVQNASAGRKKSLAYLSELGGDFNEDRVDSEPDCSSEILAREIMRIIDTLPGVTADVGRLMASGYNAAEIEHKFRDAGHLVDATWVREQMREVRSRLLEYGK